MNIYEFADIIRKNILITRINNQNGRFFARFEGGEVKKGAILAGNFGNGDTPIEALNAYKNAIVGQTLVFNAASDTARQEFIVPKRLDVEREFKDEIRDIEHEAENATLNQNTLAVDSEQANELMKIFGFRRVDPKKEEIFAGEPGVPISRVEAIQIAGETLEKAEEERLVKPASIESGYNDDFGRKIKEGDILIFKLCGRQFTGEVKRIWSNDRYCWQVWTYESPEMKLSLRHMCEDVACTEVRVIGHISTVRRGGVTVQDIGITI
jgi:hypothetical protein